MRQRGARRRDPADRLRERAVQFLAAAEAERAAERFEVAFHLARQAAELAGKRLLQDAHGSYPQSHAIGGALHQRGLTPDGLDPRRMARVLRQSTRGAYGFDELVEREEVDDAVDVARRLVDALARDDE